MDRSEAAAALASVERTRHSLAGQVAQCPLWRHAAFGLLMAILVGTSGFAAPVHPLGLALAFALGAGLFIYDRRKFGVIIYGFRRGATLPLALALLGVMLVLDFAEIHAREAGLAMATKLGLGVMAFILATAFSVQWQRLYQRELRGDRA